jgi:hypothetical protein
MRGFSSVVSAMPSFCTSCSREGIHAGGNDVAVHRQDGQPVHAGFHFLDHRRVGGEGLGFLPEVVAAHAHAVRLHPLQIGSKLGQHRVHVHTAHAGRTAHGRIEHFELFHDQFLQKGSAGFVPALAH